MIYNTKLMQIESIINEHENSLKIFELRNYKLTIKSQNLYIIKIQLHFVIKNNETLS